MTSISSGEHPLSEAVQNMVAELERAEDWLAELKDELTRAESRCDSLLGAVDAALTAMPVAARRPFYVQVKRLRIMSHAPHRNRAGRASDAMLDILAQRGAGRIRVGDLAKALEQAGHPLGAKTVSKRLAALAARDIVVKTGHGIFRPNPEHPELRRRRLTEARERERKALKTEIAAMKASANPQAIQ